MPHSNGRESDLTPVFYMLTHHCFRLSDACSGAVALVSNGTASESLIVPLMMLQCP